jgi:Trk K+ transport system NAD-binding subunit
MRTWLQGKNIAESGLRQETGVNVVGIWEKNQFLIPTAQTRLEESTVLVLAGTEDQLERFDQSIGYGADSTANKAPVIVLGGGRVGQSVARALEDRQIDFRVVEKKTVIASRDSRFIHGSASDLDVLIKAGIHETPAVIITTHDDNLNIYLTIYCRRLRKDVQIISRASLDRNVNTLHRAGANLVMSFSSLVTATIMNLLHPQQMLMLSEGLNVFRVTVPGKLENKALVRLQIREQTGCSVVAVKKQNDIIINPEPDIVLNSDDELVLIGSAENEKRFNEKYSAAL